MKKERLFSAILVGLVVLAFATDASAITTIISSKICPIINAIARTLYTLAPTFVALMFVYGGLTYVYGADDPGTRKKGRNICIHAIIGGIIIGISVSIISLLGWSSWWCS